MNHFAGRRHTSGARPMSGPIVESPFLDEVQSAFDGPLRAGTLTISSSTYNKKAFGNAEVVLGGRYYVVRVVRDRGDVFADVRSSASSDWKPLERVLRAVGVASAPAEGLLSVKQIAELIATYSRALESGLAPNALEETQRSLRTLDSEAVKRMRDRGRQD